MALCDYCRIHEHTSCYARTYYDSTTEAILRSKENALLVKNSNETIISAQTNTALQGAKAETRKIIKDNSCQEFSI